MPYKLMGQEVKELDTVTFDVSQNSSPQQRGVAKKDTTSDSLKDFQLPELDFFFENITTHPSIEIFQTQTEEQIEKLKEVKLQWLNYLRLTANYQYGMSNAFNTNETAESNLNTLTDQVRSQYTVGVVVSIPLGDLFSQKHKVRQQKAALSRIKYEYEMAIENRKLLILSAYNQVVSELAVLRAKSDAAALYDAQMKISEQDFINGQTDIKSLSLERSRRTGAVVTYQEGRAALRNAITLLEMLTGKKLIKH